MSLLSELKRRNVFRVALLYVVASWLIMQVADVGVSLLGLPEWTGRLVFLLLAIGFPLVMVFSWVYEITPEGVKREKDVRRDESITHETARKLNTAVIVLLLLSVGGLIADRLIPEQAAVPSSAATTGPADASIAVLPFVNMSADQENEYFSDGLSEELLNLLAKIPELQVAARTSAFSFKDSDAGIPEIAEKLRVAHVLEGSVRKAGNEIRITAQLIKASDGFHLWSATWDRTLDDVFAIQDEIAAAVVRELQVTLLGEVPHARVTDPLAYEYYLQARAASDLNTEESLNQAVQLLTQALAVDPEGFERARISGERALKIDPNHARALSGLAWNAMYWERDFEKAHDFLRRAIDIEPGNASVLNSMAVLNGAFGRIDTQVSLYEAALERDPVAMSVLVNLTGTYNGRREFDKSVALIERMRQISPDSMFVGMSEAWLS